jgi:hypothetical protein
VALDNSSTTPGNAMTSTNGTSWTARTVPAGAWRSIAYGKSVFVAVGTSSYANFMSSSDGISWTDGGGGQFDTYRSVAFGNDVFVAVGPSVCATSTNGTSWTLEAMPSGDWNGVSFGGGLFVAVSSTTNYVATSQNGVTWTVRTAAASNSWQAVAYGNSVFAAVSTNGTNRVMTAP